MTNIFENTRASWVRYSDYEWRTTENGKDYLLPTKDAQPKPYDPMEDADNLVLAAADIGLMLFHKNPEKSIKAAMQAFACKYGLLGIMTALPTTAKFIEYEKVYFHKNQIIKTETMDTEDYISLFFPFRKPDFRKKGVECVWNTDDRMMMALIMTYQLEPQARDKKRIADERKKAVQPVFSIEIAGIDKQIAGTAEVFNPREPETLPQHKNVTIEIENVGKYPVRNVIVFDNYTFLNLHLLGNQFTPIRAGLVDFGQVLV